MGAGAGQGAAIALRETGGRHGEAAPHAVNSVGDTDSKDDDDEEELHFRKERSGGKRGGGGGSCDKVATCRTVREEGTKGRTGELKGKKRGED